MVCRGFFSTRDSSLKIGTDCDTPYFRLAPVLKLSAYKGNNLEVCHRPARLAVRSILTPCRTLFICVDSQGQGKTQKFASEVQRRPFTDWTNWSTWHVECDRLTSRGLCALVIAWSFKQHRSLSLTGLYKPSLSDRTASCQKCVTIRDYIPKYLGIPLPKLETVFFRLREGVPNN